MKVRKASPAKGHQLNIKNLPKGWEARLVGKLTSQQQKVLDETLDCLSETLAGTQKTGAERYIKVRMKDPKFAKAYDKATRALAEEVRERMAAIDATQKRLKLLRDKSYQLENMISHITDAYWPLCDNSVRMQKKGTAIPNTYVCRAAGIRGRRVCRFCQVIDLLYKTRIAMDAFIGYQEDHPKRY